MMHAFGNVTHAHEHQTCTHTHGNESKGDAGKCIVMAFHVSIDFFTTTITVNQMQKSGIDEK